ncbi:MAG: hypothetical protein CL469_06305 [Acidimicrobiaceae bacterium]|uniref:Lipoprotein n=1 Tax=marine metagenome TaxID=408172 RepID=A0A381XBM1_9ZZZZ|nr:hypothetical protein [Acidimicrobiaceae bacterium]|tara:strand:- start:1116 stop:1490 length:375 start_codon:yes stop_codon:yes gene_type:complete
MRRCSLIVIIALLALSCAKTEPSKPGQARNCEELVQIGRNIAELVLDEIEEKELNEIQERELNKTIKKIEDLAQAKIFLMRSSELNCSEEELKKIACLSYQGLSQKARGDITREYLRPYFEACG